MDLERMRIILHFFLFCIENKKEEKDNDLGPTSKVSFLK